MGSNADALERTITALEGLTPAHDAIVEQARSLAEALDVAGGLLDSKLHGEYRQVIKVLMEVGKKQDTDKFALLLRELRGETDAPK